MDSNDTPIIWRRAKAEYARIKDSGFADHRYREEMLELADKGIEWPCLLLSLVFLDPEMENYNPRKAIQYIRSLMQGKHFDSVYHLAEHLVSQGENTEVKTIGIKGLRSLAEAGHTLSMLSLSYYLFDGVGTEKDVTEAMSWLTKAAHLNDSEAQLSLAHRYLFGEEIPRSRSLAFYWARRAGALGNADAFWILWMEEFDDNT